MLAIFPVHYTISLYLIYFMLSSLYLISLEKLTSAIGYSDDHDYSDYMVPGSKESVISHLITSAAPANRTFMLFLTPEDTKNLNPNPTVMILESYFSYCC